jgi:outer membrane protein assembly factor BamB
MKLTAALVVVFVAACLSVVAVIAAPTSASPLQQVWYRRLDSGLGAPTVNPLGHKGVVTFFTDRVVDEASVVVALDLTDGTMLWNSTGLQPPTAAPYVRIGHLENGLLVADYVKNDLAAKTTWEGFVILVAKARVKWSLSVNINNY